MKVAGRTWTILLAASVAVLVACGKARLQSKQSHDMSDLRTIATALECYHERNNTYPRAANMQELTAAVQRCCYRRPLPQVDSYGRPLVVRSGAEGYKLTAMARDGKLDPSTAPRGPSHDPNRDIILEDGVFVAWPYGRATQ